MEDQGWTDRGLGGGYADLERQRIRPAELGATGPWPGPERPERGSREGQEAASRVGRGAGAWNGQTENRGLRLRRSWPSGSGGGSGSRISRRRRRVARA